MPAACATARPSATPTSSSTLCRHVRFSRQRPRLERAAVDELRDEIRAAIDIPDIVHGEDVRMIERGEHAGFALEAGQPIGVGDEQRRQDLDRHIASELCVARAVDVAHPAGAHQLHDLVRAEAIAALQRTAGHAVDRRPLGEAPRLLVREQQRLDLASSARSSPHASSR